MTFLRPTLLKKERDVEGTEGDKMEMDEKTMKHLREHLPEFPATGKEILEACENMSDIPEMDKKMIEEKLDAEKTYNSYEEVMEDLGMKMEKKEEEMKEEM